MFWDAAGNNPEDLAFYSLTRREVADRLEVSVTTATKKLRELVAEGLLEEQYEADFGRFGIYQYWLSQSVINEIIGQQ